MTKFTEQAIKDTFIELLSKKPLNEITIKEIVEACGINRNTFYYHFRDIPALVEEIMIEQTDKIISAHPTLDSFEDCLYAIADFVNENQTIVLHIYRSLSRTVFEKYLWKLCRRLIDNYWSISTEAQRLSPQDQDIVKNFIVCAFFGLAMDWIVRGLPNTSTRNDIHRLFTIMERSQNSNTLGISAIMHKK